MGSGGALVWCADICQSPRIWSKPYIQSTVQKDYSILAAGGHQTRRIIIYVDHF